MLKALGTLVSDQSVRVSTAYLAGLNFADFIGKKLMVLFLQTVALSIC